MYICTDPVTRNSKPENRKVLPEIQNARRVSAKLGTVHPASLNIPIDDLKVQGYLAHKKTHPTRILP